MRVHELRLAARFYILALAGAAGGAIIACLALSPRPSGRDVLVATLVAASAVIAWLRPINFGFKTKLLPDTAVSFAAILLCPVPLAALATSIGTFSGQLINRDTRDVPQAIFNSAQIALQTMAGALFLKWTGWDVASSSIGPGALPQFAIAGVLIYVVNTGLVTGIVSLQTGQRIRQVWLEATLYADRTGVISHISLIGLGLLAAVLTVNDPWALFLLAPLIFALVGMLEHHVTLRLRAEDALRGTEASLAEAQRLARLGSWDWDLTTDAQFWSDETYRVLGFAPRSFPATRSVFLTCIHPEDRTRVEQRLTTALARHAPFQLESRIRLPDGASRTVSIQGEVLLDNGGRPSRVVGMIHDVTERKALEDQLIHRAFHDPLTNLPNRALLIEHLEDAIARRDAAGLAVLFLDLDGMKSVNDTLGHAAGDQMLMTVADRLRECVRAHDTVARFGGDEFVILLQNVQDPAMAQDVADRIGTRLREPIPVGADTVNVSASIGLVFGHGSQISASQFLREADNALYRAKGAGKDRTVAIVLTGASVVDLPVRLALPDRVA